MAAQDIIVRPIITEKSMAGIGDKKYTFEVAMNATKVDIARAVEELFGVKVQKVNTLHVRGHLRRQGRSEGYTCLLYTSSWRTARTCAAMLPPRARPARRSACGATGRSSSWPWTAAPPPLPV